MVLRHTASRERKRWARLRHRAHTRGKGSVARVPEDFLTSHAVPEGRLGDGVTLSLRGAPGMPKSESKWKRWLVRIAIVLILIAIPGGIFVWYKFFRQVPQPAWITTDPDQNFLHGSIGSEAQAGLPYWLVVVLPRIFDDLLPGPGGYASLGLPWGEGDELPVGFSKKTVGFERVGFNCALCHATQYRTEPDASPVIVAAGGSNTADVQGLLEFFGRAAMDSRFSAETIMTQIDMTYPLGFVDRMLYKYLYIPVARKRLREQAEDFAWADA